MIGLLVTSQRFVTHRCGAASNLTSQQLIAHPCKLNGIHPNVVLKVGFPPVRFLKLGGKKPEFFQSTIALTSNVIVSRIPFY